LGPGALITLEPPDLSGGAVALLVPGGNSEDDGGLGGGVDMSCHEAEIEMERVSNLQQAMGRVSDYDKGLFNGWVETNSLNIRIFPTDIHI
jgi:hypothetical protein